MKEAQAVVVPPPRVLPVGKQWHVVECWSGRELQVLVELAAMQLETFLPLCLPEDGGPLEPAFPGYVFVFFDQSDLAWRGIHKRPGVIQVLRQDAERPRVISMEEMARLVVAYGQGGAATMPGRRPVWSAVRVGAAVRVIDGPFTSFPGVVLQDLGARLRVAVRIFGRDTECLLPRAAVVPL